MVSNLKRIFTNGRIAALFVLAILVIDQLIKVWVKTHMYLHERIHITDWFYLLFTENNGMAFGAEFVQKIVLTSFRVLASAFIIYYLHSIIKKGAKMGYVICIAMILAGALGNVVDCLFYGLVFNAPYPPEVAQFVPWGEGYQSFCHGRVVDMFYFPLFSFDWPEWVPLVGGSNYLFFSPVFNFADASISVGVFFLLFCYRIEMQKYNVFSDEKK